MPNNNNKFLFLGAVVVVALASRLAYPAFYPDANGSSGAGGASSSLSADAPLLILPPIISSSSDAGDSMAPSSSSSVAPNIAASADSAPVASAGSVVTVNDSFGSGSMPPFIEVGHASPPGIADEASLIADLSTGDIFLSSNLDMRWPMASVTKLMTASLVIDDMSSDETITIPPAAVAMDPSQTLLAAGDRYAVADLLKVMLLPSSNVAAESFADSYGRAQFIAAMNARAASWGMTDTHYNDPSGLSSANESTPDDLLKLAQKIYTDYPQILAITRTPQVTVTNLATNKPVVVKSINDFAGRADFIGGKTGYTDEADGNLLSIFNYENRPVLVLVMGTDDSDRFVNSSALYNWFTTNFK